MGEAVTDCWPWNINAEFLKTCGRYTQLNMKIANLY